MCIHQKYAELSTDAIQKLWNYHIDLDNKNAATSYKIAFQKVAKYTKYAWKNHISKFDHKHFKDQQLKRRFHFLSILGDSALDENKFAEFMNITSYMNTVFQKAKDKDLLIHVWTINNKETITELIKMGVHGIVTDEPNLIMDIMKEKNLIFSKT